jgi:hypothetical protein
MGLHNDHVDPADDPPMDPPVPPGATIVMIVADVGDYLDGPLPTYADSDYVPPPDVFNGPGSAMTRRSKPGVMTPRSERWAAFWAALRRVTG